MSGAPDGPAVKAAQARNFDDLNAAVATSPFGRHLRFLNFGYVPLPHEERAGPALGRSFPNAESAQLLFQVVGATNLRGARVVEIGCGRGGNLWLLDRHASPANLVGIDLAASSVAYCVSTLGPAGAQFVVGDAEAVPLATGCADAVISIETACTYPDIEQFFREVGRLVPPGGHFLYADLLPQDLLAPIVTAMGRLGFSVLETRDISANVLAARNQRADRQGLAFGASMPTAEWVGLERSVNRSRLGDGSVTYVLARFERTAVHDPGPEPLLDDHQQARARAGAELSAELLRIPAVDEHETAGTGQP